ncbi:hypothetical protein [Mycobacterium sp. GA-2829]|uniref:hypothetical protein n=1 Tax=Mycobacterium sp. GA-2829 TaxID=1772283 RepID=UPI00073FF539|nr:hypothetical protein [Mycobacterium sp. GA-2829]KUI36204.1 hypothetical protein AU194_15930 [Mycobacterium sp. GA-2829]
MSFTNLYLSRQLINDMAWFGALPRIGPLLAHTSTTPEPIVTLQLEQRVVGSVLDILDRLALLPPTHTLARMARLFDLFAALMSALAGVENPNPILAEPV